MVGIVISEVALLISEVVVVIFGVVVVTSIDGQIFLIQSYLMVNV